MKLKIFRFFDTIFEFILEFIFTNKCIGCFDTLDFGVKKPFCDKCFFALSFICEPFCEKCGGSFETEVCTNCDGANYLFSRNVSLTTYDEFSKQIVHNFKFNNHPEFARGLARALHPLFLEHFQGKVDMLVSVPMTLKKINERGYNQSFIVAKELSKLTQVPFTDKILLKTKNTLKQSGLNEKERKENISGAFLATSGASGLNILLIDDVFTTGNTANEAARALLAANACSVSVLTFAKTVKK